MDGPLLLLSLAAAFAFALALVLTQLGLRTLTPIQGACVSVPTTTVLFLVLSPLTVDLSQWQAESAALFAAAGVFFPAAVTVLTFAANRHIGPNLTGALGNTTPLFAVALAVLLLGEAPSAGQAVGIAAVALGIAVLYGGRKRAGPAVAAWALILPLAAALVRGTTQPVVKLGLEAWPDPFAAVTIGYVVSAAAILIAGRARGVKIADLRAPGRYWFAAVGLSNGLAVLCLYAALAHGPVTLVAPLVACYPLLTLVLNRLLLGDRSLARHAALGILITVAGVALLLQS